MYLEHAVPEPLRSYVRRILVLDARDEIDVITEVRPTGYIFLGHLVRGQGILRIGDDEEKLRHSNDAVFTHISGQVLSQDIKLHLLGDVGHVLFEFTGLGCYELLGIEGEATIDICQNPSIFNPDLANTCDIQVDSTLGHIVDQTKNETIDFLMSRIPHARTVPNFLRDGIAEIEKSGGKVNLNDMCERLDVSSRHFARLFTKIVGQSPKRFCQILQLNRAVKALVEEDFEYLAEVALDAGFSDQSHFNRVFQRRLMTNPLAFLNSGKQLLKVFLAEN